MHDTSHPADAEQQRRQISLEEIRSVIDLIRPAVQSDGGDIELVGVTASGVVQVRLHGACVGCPESTGTLQGTVERSLKNRIAGITAVQAVD